MFCGTVLVVDDNLTNQKVFTTMLKALGLEVRIAGNGRAGADLAVSDDSIDLILMDLNMPVMNGLEAVKQIRAWEASSGKPRRPVIALTGDVFEEDRELCLQAGMDDHLSKPIGLQALRAVLAKYLAPGQQTSP